MPVMLFASSTSSFKCLKLPKEAGMEPPDPHSRTPASPPTPAPVADKELLQVTQHMRSLAAWNCCTVANEPNLLVSCCCLSH